jgi:hypothetical protein
MELLLRGAWSVLKTGWRRDRSVYIVVVLVLVEAYIYRTILMYVSLPEICNHSHHYASEEVGLRYGQKGQGIFDASNLCNLAIQRTAPKVAYC